MRADSAHTIDYRLDGDASDAQMDRQLLRQIFSNLLTNAIKYSPEGAIIHFRVQAENGWAIFQVEDHGIGIPDDEQTHLFDTFYRARNVGNIPGTGLGLSIVKSSVDLHGGSVSFKSRVGAGTTFTVKLPLRPR
jgi:signal transduction histidine kinase